MTTTDSTPTIPCRQGDVLLMRVDSIPEDAVPVKPHGDRLIIEYGETSGHHHSVSVLDAELLVTGTADAADQYLRVHRETTLTHQEHPSVLLEPGIYRRIPQYEYRPAALPQRVVD